jgi:MoxR-like ATPase
MGGTEGDPATNGHEPSTAELLERTLFEVKRVIVGQDRMVERMLAALIAGGHCLIEGVPGVAKTLAARTLATVVGGTFARVQFTPDLVPSDILGTRIYRASREGFDIEYGPVMANILLADEINRAPAKVQSALLEVMAEGQVSIGGTTKPVPSPFLVLATQNPIESEGVYPLPEAQRDRFLMKILVGYPNEAEELGILYRMSADRPTAHRNACSPCRLFPGQCSCITRSPSTWSGWCSPPEARPSSVHRNWLGCWPTARVHVRHSGWSRRPVRRR